MASWIVGPFTWSLTRDTEGHREYKITHRVRTDDDADGPGIVLRTPGLPVPGAWWIIGNDVDLWAWCRPNAEVEPEIEGEPNCYWKVTQTFSTKPPEGTKAQRCQDNEIEDPLLEPAKVSGTFIKYTEEASTDRFGNFLTNSAWEMFRGPSVEFDANRLQVRVEQNVVDAEVPILQAMIDTVNPFPLWGFARRCVKLSAAPWEKKLYGTCYTYYTRTLEFDTNTNTFDRDVLDEGTKMLRGHWEKNANDKFVYVIDPNANPMNPKDFVRAQDPHGNYIRIGLNGAGEPAGIVSMIGGYFISMSNGNTGNDLDDSDFWTPFNPNLIETDPANVAEWEFDTTYPRGAVVNYNGDLYIAVGTVRSGNIPVSGPDWILIGGGIPLDAGDYDASTTYNLGDYVKDVEGTNTVAYRHIEKYPESNFLLLGIPTQL